MTVDITVEELRERLREGKIYPPDQVEQALKNFFRPSNLSALRELALREVARDVGRHREELERFKIERGRPPAVTERVMACLSSNPVGSAELLRKAARTAERLNAEWYAVHVETPAESIAKISASDFRALLDNINLAADLGAEIVWLKSSEVVKALLDFAREKHITRIVAGRTRPTFWNIITGHSLSRRLIAAAFDFDIELLRYEPPNDNPWSDQPGFILTGSTVRARSSPAVSNPFQRYSAAVQMATGTLRRHCLVGNPTLLTAKPFARIDLTIAGPI